MQTTQHAFGASSAIQDLAQVEKTEVRLVVSRCIKRSRHGIPLPCYYGDAWFLQARIFGRYSRLGSCWEAAEMLASASSWFEPHGLSSGVSMAW